MNLPFNLKELQKRQALEAMLAQPGPVPPVPWMRYAMAAVAFGSAVWCAATVVTSSAPMEMDGLWQRRVLFGPALWLAWRCRGWQRVLAGLLAAVYNPVITLAPDGRWLVVHAWAAVAFVLVSPLTELKRKGKPSGSPRPSRQEDEESPNSLWDDVTTTLGVLLLGGLVLTFLFMNAAAWCGTRIEPWGESQGPSVDRRDMHQSLSSTDSGAWRFCGFTVTAHAMIYGWILVYIVPGFLIWAWICESWQEEKVRRIARRLRGTAPRHKVKR